MPIANIRGAAINYQVLGSTGPWVALSPGGRRGMDAVEGLASRLAAKGYRVLIHDRRNTGASDITIGGKESEYEIWADDLHALLQERGGLPAVVGGSSSGCRTSLLFALRYPQAVRALLLWRVTGGRFACERLAENYYGQFIKLAQSGGMQAVAESEHWAERIQMRPQNRDVLMKMDVKQFIAAMEHWRSYFLRGADQPVIGVTDADLKSIKVPTLIIPGNDKTHGNAIGDIAKRLIPNSELHKVMGPDMEVDLGPIEEWTAKDPEIAALFDGFLRRALQPAAA
jgi:pimeloyl-ACP methyl ester carboxylesterase